MWFWPVPFWLTGGVVDLRGEQALVGGRPAGLHQQVRHRGGVVLRDAKEGAGGHAEADVDHRQVPHEVELLHDDVAYVDAEPGLDVCAQNRLVGNGRVQREQLASRAGQQRRVVGDVHHQHQQPDEQGREVGGPAATPARSPRARATK